MAFSRVHALVMTTPDDPAYECKPSNWNDDHTVSGADVGGIPYCPTATTETTSANLTYTETSGPRLQVGSGTTTAAGFIIGYTGTSGYGAIWPTGTASPSISNYAFLAVSNLTSLNCLSGTLDFRTANTTKGAFQNVAGRGFDITAGTATTDVPALSATQTWNAAGVTFTGFKYSVSNTASAALSLHSQWNGGAAGATQLMALNKNGDLTALGAGTFSGAVTATDFKAGAGNLMYWTGRSRMSSSADGFIEFADFAGTSGAVLGLLERTAPSGTSNTARIFAQDNGGGKTQLMVIFGSGAAQQIAIEA